MNSSFKNYCKNRILYNLFRILLFIILSAIAVLLGNNITIMRVYALETETIYSDNNNCTFSNSGKYKNISNNGTISTNNIATTYQGKSYGMQFFFAEDMLTTKVYQLKITFMSNDLLPRVNENFIELVTYDTSCESDYATILSIEKNTTSGNATTLQINFIPSMTSNKARILIGSSSGPLQITGETNFGIRNVQIGDRESQGNEQIIINNNQNAQNIINNQNENTQELINSNKVCSNVDKNNIEIDNKYLDSNGNQQPSNNYGITEYIKIDTESIIKVLTSINSEAAKYCFYTSSKDLISCNNISNSLEDTELTIPSNADYIRSSIQKVQNKPTFQICKNGNQAIADDNKEAEKTRKGILKTLMNIPQAIGDMLVGIFVPSSEDLQPIIEDLQTWFNTKFGVLSQLITTTIDFIQRFYNLSDDYDVIIHIPEIKVPNFENDIALIQEQDFNWTELIESKQTLNNLWTLYLDFMDVIIIIAFLYTCEDILEDILNERKIGGESIYESEGESYDVDDKTGELKNHKYWTKRSEKVK